MQIQELMNAKGGVQYDVLPRVASCTRLSQKSLGRSLP